MAPKVAVDPSQILDAADVFGSQVAPDVANAVYTLTSGMTGGMAGNDDAGQTWSSSYDQATKTVMGVSADVVNGCYKLASLLQVTSGNWSQADARSMAAHLPPDDRPPIYADDSFSPLTIPSAAGGSSDTPTGWSLVEHAVGYVWPGGHQDQLRAAANAWSTAAAAVTEAGSPIPGATVDLILQETPEMGNAYVVSRSMGDHLTTLSTAFLGLRDACNNYAAYLDKAHSDAEGELRSLLEWTAGIEGVGGLISFFSAGIAEVPTQAVEAGRVAKTAKNIADIIETLIRAAQSVTEAIGNAVGRVIDVSSNLKALLGARLSEATATLVARLPGVAKTAEELATTTLETAADSSAADDTLYENYLARKAGEGKPPLSREAWQSKLDNLRTNKAVGDAYRDQVMSDLGITKGEGGWDTEVTVPGTGRRLDFANLHDPSGPQGYEVKSGSTPTAEGLTQMSKDEGLVRKGWTITWQLKTDLSPTLMARLEELAAKYPGEFNYTVSGG